MATPIIGFVGLGRMGGPMSGRLAAAGSEVHVFDQSADALKTAETAGCKAAASAQEVANKADIVFISLPTPAIVNSVVLGEDGLAGGSRVRIVVDLSTTGPGVAGQVSKGLAEHGKAW